MTTYFIRNQKQETEEASLVVEGEAAQGNLVKKQSDDAASCMERVKIIAKEKAEVKNKYENLMRYVSNTCYIENTTTAIIFVQHLINYSTGDNSGHIGSPLLKEVCYYVIEKRSKSLFQQ